MWLTSKLEQPAPLPDSVPRPRLFTLLDDWSAYRVIIVHAAAGYGKTSLVADWLARQPAPARFATLALDPDDNDPIRFMRYLAAALDRIRPGLLPAVLPILEDTQPDPTQAMAALLLALESADPPTDRTPLLLILDDYHRAESPPIDALLSRLLEQAGPELHVIILSRTMPNLPLGRYFLAGTLLELSANEMRFTRDELTAFMAAYPDSQSDPAHLDALMRHTEGWIAGVKLAVLSMNRRPDPATVPEPLRGTDIVRGADPWQAEYLTGEVLNRQSPAMRRFLLETSILNRFDAGLCAAVTGRLDAGILLGDAFRAGLFLVPLDKRHDAFRYHHLFQDVLQARLVREATTDEVQALHRRAAAWYVAAWERERGPEANDDGDAAMRHLLATGDTATVAALLERLVRRAIDDHDLHQADIWLGRLPNAELDRHPGLLLLLCDLNARRTEPALATNVARTSHALRQISTNDASRSALEARLNVYQALVAFNQRRLDLLHDYAKHAGRHEQHLNDFERAVLRLMQYEDAVLGVAPKHADEHALLAVAAFIQADYAPGVITTRQEMAVRLMYVGRLTDALRDLEQLINDNAQPQPNYVLRELQYTHLQAAETAYWMNDLQRVRQHAVRGAQLGRELNDVNAIAIAAQLLDLYNLAAPSTPELGYTWPRPPNVDQAGAFAFNVEVEVVYQVTQGNGSAAVILSRIPQDVPPDLHKMAPSRLVTYTLAHIAAGHHLPALDEMVAFGLRRFKEDDLLFFLARLQASESWRQIRMGNRTEAIRMLRSSIALAEETGMVRHILNLPALGPLIPQITHPMARRLAPMMGPAPDTFIQRINQLSPREQEILIQLTRDYRYADIAAYLDITLDTTRWHIKRIYRKLGVSGRLAATEIARRAGLI